MPSNQSLKSRYLNTPIRTAALADGTVIDVLENRALPEPADPLASEALWTETERGERLDSVADRVWRNAGEYWRLLDATTALEAADLEAAELDSRVPVGSAKLLLPEEG